MEGANGSFSGLFLGSRLKLIAPKTEMVEFDYGIQKNAAGVPLLGGQNFDSFSVDNLCIFLEQLFVYLWRKSVY